jgi:hypothetical protein
MLFTPAPPIPSQPVSSSVKDQSPPLTLPQTPSASSARYIQNRPRSVSSANTITLVTNGPRNNRLLSTSQSRFSQLPDQDWFYSSPPPASSSSRPSVHHLTPTSAKLSDTKTSSTNRRVSCPVPRHNNTKRESRFRFPTNITSSIREALMTTTSKTNPHTDDISHVPKLALPGCPRPSTIFLPIANPVAAAALVEDDESLEFEEQASKSATPSPLGTPKSSARAHRTPTECSTSVDAPHIYSTKVTLNVGGVRHEGNFDCFIIF